MPSINQPDLILQSLLAANMAEQARKHGKEDPKAALAQLSKVMEEVLATVAPAAAGSSRAPSSPPAPTNAEMQRLIGQLMGLLTQLQGEIAKFGQINALANAGIGQALMTEMQAQVENANEQLQKMLKDDDSSNFWSIFTKVGEAVLGAVIAAIATLCGQPEIAVMVIIFTVLAVSGGMDKIAEGLSDAVSKALVSAGAPQHDADIAAKIIADVVIIAASIAITVLTCGGGAGAVAEEVAEAGEEGASAAASTAEGTASEAAVDSTESFTQRMTNFFSKVGDYIKENNPFNKLPKNVNLAIFGAGQAIGSTNFGQNVMAAALVRMRDDKAKKELKMILGTAINLVAALSAAGAAASACAGPGNAAFQNTANWIKGLEGVKLAAGAGVFSGQTGLAVTYGQRAVLTAEQGATQAFISMLQSLISMNSQQSASDAKALSAKESTWGKELASLSHTLNLESAAVAQALHA